MKWLKIVADTKVPEFWWMLTRVKVSSLDSVLLARAGQV